MYLDKQTSTLYVRVLKSLKQFFGDDHHKNQDGMTDPTI